MADYKSDNPRRSVAEYEPLYRAEVRKSEHYLRALNEAVEGLNLVIQHIADEAGIEPLVVTVEEILADTR